MSYERQKRARACTLTCVVRILLTMSDPVTHTKVEGTCMRWFPVAAVLLASTACASAPVERDFEPLADYRGASFTEVWDLVIDVFRGRNWAIESLQRDSGIITTEWVRTDNESYRDCGSAGFRASHSDHTGRFRVVVRETVDGVSIRVTTSWRAVRNDARAIGIMECLSTGISERELHRDVRERLGRG